MEDFRFTNESPDFRTDEIVHYLTGPRLWIPYSDYPNIPEWVQKVYTQLRSEEKRAMVAYYGREIVGVTIYQSYKQDPKVLEIKNLTVRPDMRGRHVASFLLRNTEIEGAKDYGAESVICDAKESNISILGFLVSEHYAAVGKADLYGLGAGEDLIFKKLLIPPEFRRDIYRLDRNRRMS